MIVESIFQDLRIGLRSLARRPAFTLIAASSLALGIGLVATQFSLIDGVLLRGLPIADGQRLMHVGRQDPQNPDPTAWDSIPYRDYYVILERQTSFEALAAVNEFSTMNLSGGGRVPSSRAGALASANLLDVLGVHPLLGRWFTEAEDRPGQSLKVVISHQLWLDEFQGEPGAIGQPLTVNGEPGVIIGVMPPHFVFPVLQQVWINLRASAASSSPGRAHACSR